MDLFCHNVALMELGMQKYSTNIPNTKTKKAIEDVEKGKGVKSAKNVDDLKRQLGLSQRKDAKAPRRKK